jgi:hypothetical protein
MSEDCRESAGTRFRKFVRGGSSQSQEPGLQLMGYEQRLKPGVFGDGRLDEVSMGLLIDP